MDTGLRQYRKDRSDRMGPMEHPYRHEFKYLCSYGELAMLKVRLAGLLLPDPHAGKDGLYNIRSLYFDDYYDSCLRENEAGTDPREKFRIRYYNEDPSFIRLEKKSKVNGLCRKESAVLQREQVQALLDGDDSWMLAGGDELVKELYVLNI